MHCIGLWYGPCSFHPAQCRGVRVLPAYFSATKALTILPCVYHRAVTMTVGVLKCKRLSVTCMGTVRNTNRNTWQASWEYSWEIQMEKNVKSHSALEMSSCKPNYSRSYAGDFRQDQKIEKSVSIVKGKPPTMLLTRNDMCPLTSAKSEDHTRVVN